MEVMSTFELGCTIFSLGHLKTISFQMFWEEFMISYMDFSLQIGVVEVKCTHSSTSTCRST